ncbi:6-phospho-beta-glucosidase [Fictibacillus enclensis]|uniref:6-phospho-beta-glucosidase n=1 Tax=Fictibacillus enclensis TaxID=1017270 RepID=UPI0025A19B03|nr:6-phospho-beta-glucosidase [Fictibacillus enclensis]MDM5338440.1 6-phospho-beta-glucosidase [Fictibacillus enclensis]
MKNGLKVAVIGGGSSYTPELIEGFIERHEEFPVQELFLVDINEGKEKLEIVGELARRMIQKGGVPIHLTLTFDREEAITGADFVITQLRVGMLEARSRDERIPLRYQCIGQETTGAGGFAKALRTIPVILDICRDIEKYAPEAFLINFTNPAGVVTEAVNKYSTVNAIGLCNLPINTRKQLAEFLNVDANEIEIEMAGINHLNWTTKIWVKNKDVTESFLNGEADLKGFNMNNIPDLEWNRDFLQALDALPCGYHRYYYKEDEVLKHQLEQLQETGTRADEVKKVEAALFKRYQDPNLSIKPPELAQRGGAFYSEAAVDIMSSIYNNKKDIQTVNVQNNGILSCLPDTASIEVNCVIDRQGAHPIQLTTKIDARIRGLLQVVKAYEEMTIEAAVHGDYAMGLLALTTHPLVKSASVAEKIFQDILNENKTFLPQFFSESKTV